MQVFIFLFMDCMRVPAPLVRIAFAVTLLARFTQSFLKRTANVYAPEQLPVLPQDGLLEGVGVSSKQSFIRAIDWTVIAMLASSIITVVLHPQDLAVVRLRCNTLSYSNWHDHYDRQWKVRAHRRDLLLEDKLVRFRARKAHRKHALYGAAATGGLAKPWLSLGVKHEAARKAS